jgi:TonB family protein
MLPASPETSLIADRVFLAFETGEGRAYVQAVGWQRTYLLWTFRNFRGVPHKILNARQRRMVEALYPAASISLGRAVDEDSVIGRVEDFVPPFHVPVQVTTVAKKPVSGIPARKTARGSARTPLHANSGRLDFSWLTRTVSTGAVIVIVAAVTWQQLRTRPVVSASTPVPAVMQSRVESRAGENRALAIAPVAIPTSTTFGSQALPAQLANAAAIAVTPVPAISDPPPATIQSSDAVRSSEQGPGKRDSIHNAISANHSASTLAGIHDGPTVLPRVKISGPPQKLVYPVCPDSSTRGKVSLQAVVGSDGTVSQIRVLGGNRVLAAAAKRAIREWRYEPFSANAQKLEREARITVSFISDDVVAVSFPDAPQVSR